MPNVDKKMSKYVLLVLVSLLLETCEGQDKKEDKGSEKTATVLDILEKNYKEYFKLVKSVYLHPILVDRQVTVFAPSDKSLANLPVDKRLLLQRDLNAVYSMVLYQTILGKVVTSSYFEDGLFLLTGLNNKAFLNVQIRNSTRHVWIQGVKLTKVDILAKDGIIHELDGPLTPPTASLYRYLHDRREFQTFLTILERAQLLLPVGYTALVPPDGVFWKIPEEKRMFLLGSRESNKELANMHVIPKTVYTSLIDDKPMTVHTLHRKLMTFNRTQKGIALEIPPDNEKGQSLFAVIQEPDISFQNGVIHIISNFIQPDPEEIDLLNKLEAKNLTLFSKELTKTGFRPYLTYRGAFYTIFAPSNKAFEEAQKTIENDVSFTDRIIRFHILPGKILLRNLRKFKEMQSMSGDMIMLRKFSQVSMAEKGIIKEPDLETKNGVLHIVDQVLLPRTESVSYALAIRGKPRVSTFLRAMTRAGLQPLIQDRRRFPNIFWVPSDAAFKTIPPKTLKYLFNNVYLLRKFLRYHIVPGFFYSRLMHSRWVYLFKTRLQGASIRVRAMMIGSEKQLIVYNPYGKTAKTIVTDHGAVNGIINIIDQVLVPTGWRIPGIKPSGGRIPRHTVTARV